MNIGLSYDLKEAVSLGKEQPEDALEEYDSSETVDALKSAIEAKGHSVVKLGGGREFLKHILQEKVDFVFNISEGLGSYRSREAQVPSVLEMLDIPYSGADPQCLAVCLDKTSDQEDCFLGRHLPHPNGVSSARARSNPSTGNHCPIRPSSNRSGKVPAKASGSTPWSASRKQMKTAVTALLEQVHQPVLVEEFISGEEVTVGMVGNSPPTIVGIMRVVPRKKDADFVYSLEVKRDYEKLVDYECPAKLENKTLQLIQEYSLKAFEVLECRDFARVDFRVSQDGTPYFLEINPLAGLNPRSSDLIIMAKLMGISYNELIGSILDAALKRYGY